MSILLASAVVFTPENSEVVISSDAPKTVLFAAEEATNFLSRVFGAPVPIVTAPSVGRASLSWFNSSVFINSASICAALSSISSSSAPSTLRYALSEPGKPRYASPLSRSSCISMSNGALLPSVML